MNTRGENNGDSDGDHHPDALRLKEILRRRLKSQRHLVVYAVASGRGDSLLEAAGIVDDEEISSELVSTISAMRQIKALLDAFDRVNHDRIGTRKERRKILVDSIRKIVSGTVGTES